MPRWNSPSTIRKLFVQNDEPERLGEFLSNTLLPVQFERHPTATRFQHQAEIGVIGDVLIWDIFTETGYIANWNNPPSHRFEIRFIDVGECHSRAHDQEVSAVAGQVYLIYDARDHHVEAAPGTRKLCISIPFGYYARLASTTESDPVDLIHSLSPVIDGVHPAARVIRGIANLLHADGAQDNPLASLPLPAAILKEALLQAFISSWPKVEAGKPYRPAPRHIRRAVEWIEHHVQQKITLSDIAKAAGTSPRTLQTLFQKQFGMSPIQYVVKLRLHHVHDDLSDVENDHTILDIANKWGFRHISDFERYYKEHYGHTPHETRRQARFQQDIC